MPVHPSVFKIHTRFKNFNKEMNEIWESYNLINVYSKNLHDQVKNNQIPPLRFEKLRTLPETRILKKDATLGAISRFKLKTNGRRALLEAVASFEHFLNELVTTVYIDFPDRLLNASAPESVERGEKLLNIIINSGDKEEMIEKIVEEKTRSIFYGKPSDFFKKDKAKLNFENFFTVATYEVVLKKYEEVTGRRNLVAHNNGKVDRKYLREIEGTTYTLGQKPPINEPYLREALYTLKGLASCATALVVQKTYKETARGKLSQVYQGFTRLL